MKSIGKKRNKWQKSIHETSAPTFRSSLLQMNKKPPFGFYGFLTKLTSVLTKVVKELRAPPGPAIFFFSALILPASHSHPCNPPLRDTKPKRCSLTAKMRTANLIFQLLALLFYEFRLIRNNSFIL